MAAYREGNKDLAKACLFGLNALLPEDLRLIIDHDEAVKEDTPVKKLQCIKCKEMLLFEGKLETVRHTPKYYFGDIYPNQIQIQKGITCKCGHFIQYRSDLILSLITAKSVKRFIRPAPNIDNIMGDMVNTWPFWEWLNTAWEILEMKHLQNRVNVGSAEEGDPDA